VWAVRGERRNTIRPTATGLIFEESSVGPPGRKQHPIQQGNREWKTAGVAFRRREDRTAFFAAAASDQSGIGSTELCN